MIAQKLPKTCPQYTPWGPIQHASEIAPGIVSVGTAGHGGIHLSAERKRKLLRDWPALAGCSEGGHGTWYEEDCAVNAVRIAFAAEFDAFAERTEWARGWRDTWTVESAKSSIRHSYPSVARDAGFGWTESQYAASVVAALRGEPIAEGLPNASAELRHYSAHVVGGNSSDAAWCVHVVAAGITVGYFDGTRLHCGQYVRQFASDDSYFTASRDAALDELANPTTATRLTAMLPNT